MTSELPGIFAGSELVSSNKLKHVFHVVKVYLFEDRSMKISFSAKKSNNLNLLDSPP